MQLTDMVTLNRLYMLVNQVQQLSTDQTAQYNQFPGNPNNELPSIF